MAKKFVIHDQVEIPQVPESAKTQPVSLAVASRAVEKSAEPPRKPFQVQWPEAEIRAAKKAALDAGQSYSDYMLACFHAFSAGEAKPLT